MKSEVYLSHRNAELFRRVNKGNEIMKIIVFNEEIGLIWYKSRNYQQKEVHVICFGLQVEQYEDEDKAKEAFKNCLDWHFRNN